MNPSELKIKNEDTVQQLWDSTMMITGRFIGALAVIGTGVVFFLDAAGSEIMRGNSNWWVVYLLTTGISFCIGALIAFQKTGSFNRVVSRMAGIAAVLFILSVIFIFDPTWSFTQGLTLFDNINWNLLWPIAVIVVGVGMLVGSLRRK